MKLQLITVQGACFDDYYADCVVPNINSSWLAPIERIRKLLDHLQQNVEGPPQWVTISHMILFHLSDEDDWRPENACVFVSLSAEGYTIKYRSKQELHYWDSFTRLEAKDIKEAGQMIVQALELAERELKGRGDA